MSTIMEKDSKHKILIVEDTEAISKAISLKLESESFEVITASSGEEALNAVEKDIFDVILLDLVIPDLNGFTILEKFKEKNISNNVIVLSNLSQPEDIEKAKAYGIKEYFVKSEVSIAKVVEYIQNCLTNANR